MKFRTILQFLLVGAMGIGGVSMGGLVGCKKPTLPNAAKPLAEAPAAAAEPVAPPPAEALPPPKVRQPDTKGSVIALCYHRFEEKPKDAMAVTPAAFEAQMQALKESGFTVIPMQDFLAWRRGEKSIPQKSCLISIDDGYRSGYEVAWPILKKYEYPFTMFIYTAFVKGGALAGGASLSWAELAEMRDAGVDIQSHTTNHQSLRMKKGKFQNQFATYEEWLQNEIAGSKHQLESRLGISVKVLAYPYGIHSEQVRALALASGYEAAFTTYGQRLTYHSPADQLGRYAIEHNKPKIFTDALAMIGGGGGMVESAAASVPGQIAATGMVTVPMEGEVVHELKPELKANLAALGEVEPGTVEIRVSGVGAVPVKYDPATKLAVGTLLQPLKDREITVILSALLRGKKVEVRWNFSCDAVAPSGLSAGVPAVPGAPAVQAVSGAGTGSPSSVAAPAAAGGNAEVAPR
jgi:peptidoglycan/xylan/chitin deacetylase (PgdA/CDA1 family)